MTPEEFKKKFKLPFEYSTQPIDFINGGFGFSFLKNYPNNNDYASLFKIYIRKEEVSSNSYLKTIEASVSYGKKDKEGETEGIILSSSSEKIKGLFDPIDLISFDDFSCNFLTEEFFCKNERIEAEEILKILDKWHQKTTTFFGIPLVIRLFWFHYLLAWFWKRIFEIFSILQYFVSGEKIKIFYNLFDPSKSFNSNLENKLETDKSVLIDLWGYQVKSWIASIYALLHLGGYFALYHFNKKPLWLSIIFNNNFLTLMYGIVSLGMANTLLPIVFKSINFKNLLKQIQSCYIDSISKKIELEISWEKLFLFALFIMSVLFFIFLFLSFVPNTTNPNILLDLNKCI